jgi:hypothetical protein
MEFLAGLEAHSLAGCDADLGASPWVAANACFTGADAEYAKSAQFDALTGGKCLFQALEYRIHRGLCLGAGQARALDYMMDDVLLNQWGNLAGKFDFTTTDGNDATSFNAIVKQPKPAGGTFIPGKLPKYPLNAPAQPIQMRRSLFSTGRQANLQETIVHSQRIFVL